MIEALADLLRWRRVVVLTGAGCSTESGIPDYRGPETRRRARNPVKFQEFVGDEARRRRYWSRSAIGWPRVSSVEANAGHRALAALEAAGVVEGIITQNVDGLHQRAGSRRVVELHGSLSEVTCLGCGAIEARALLQRRLLALNPGWEVGDRELAPDGDAEVETAAEARFAVPGCLACGGVLKPRMVFFGENVPRSVYEDALALMAGAGALLIVGSSLAVYSGYRFLLQAREGGLPVGMINLGPPMRGAEQLDVHVDGAAGASLEALCAALGVRPDAARAADGGRAERPPAQG